MKDILQEDYYIYKVGGFSLQVGVCISDVE